MNNKEKLQYLAMYCGDAEAYFNRIAQNIKFLQPSKKDTSKERLFTETLKFCEYAKEEFDNMHSIFENKIKDF